MRKFLNSVIILSLAIVLLIGQLSAASATNLNTELVVNGTAETGNISGWTDDTNANRWSSSTAYSSWALPAEGSYYFFLYNPSMDFLSGTMSQVITLTDENGLFSSISSGNVSINFSIYMYQAISVSNEAKAILEEYDAGGTLLNTSQVVNTTSSGAMGSYQINTQVNPNTRSFKVILSATLTTGGYAQFDKVSLKLVDASSGSAPVIGSDFPTSGETDAGVTYGPVPFTVSDPDAGDVNILTFTASSTNVNLIPAANITIGGSGANRTLTIVPAGNLSGESDITVTASDGSKSSGKTLHFIVHKVIAMDTNLVENSNGTDGLANWTGNTVNISATGNGFVTNSPGTYMSQNIDISKFSTLIDGGETKFVLSAEFPSTYGEVTAQFFSDIACTNPVGSSPLVHGSTPSLEQKIPANAKGVKITFRNTSSSYNNVTVRNISFKVLDDFPKITPISNQATNISAFTVPVYAYYTTESATLNATSSDQTIVPNTGISVGGSGFNRSITFTPLKNGIVTITLTLNDGTSTVTTNFKVTVLDPTVVSSVNTPTAGYYAVGQNLDFTVNFNNAITGGTSSTLPLTIGGTAVYASYLSGTSNSITYRYTIGGNDTGVVAIGNAIDDTSSPIIDEIGHDADTELSAGATGITVVKTPQVTSTATEGSATYGDNITFTATLNCTDSLTGTIQFKANGSNLGSPVTVSGNAASFETESMLSAGSVSITAVFVPSGTTYHFTSLTSNVYALVVQQKSVTISGLTATAKTYDGTTSVTLSGGTLVGALTGEDVSAVCPTAGTAASKNAGTQSVAFTTIVLSGTAKDNYILTAQPSVSLVISPKPVTATVNISNKAYDGNTNAAVTCGFTSGDIVTGDTVTVTAV
ncbi:MAG: YDG domain-containing protein, partial [Clostridiaceae bacterium]|nr:YDG domain-containing protein [Clostridiaceae bacterium]